MLRVLTYHRVADPDATPELDPALVSATPDVFRAQMRHLASRYRPVDLHEVARAFRSGASLPRRPVLVTFDDAYRDFGEIAWPILRELGIPATVFVPTAFPGAPRASFWWDRLHRARSRSPDGRTAEVRAGNGEPRDPRTLVKTLPPDEAQAMVDRLCAGGPDERPSPGGPEERPSAGRPPVLDWSELRRLAAEGVRLGAHTHTHAALVPASDDRVRQELRRSAEELRERIGGDVTRSICYPYGQHDDRVVRIAREEGFELGFTNIDGLGRPGRTDPLRLPRTNVTRRTSPPVFRLRMRPWFAPIDRWRHRHERAASGGRRVEDEAS